MWYIVKSKSTVETFLNMIHLLELEDKDFKSAILAMFKNVKEMMLNR